MGLGRAWLCPGEIQSPPTPCHAPGLLHLNEILLLLTPTLGANMEMPLALEKGVPTWGMLWGPGSHPYVPPSILAALKPGGREWGSLV